MGEVKLRRLRLHRAAELGQPIGHAISTFGEALLIGARAPRQAIDSRIWNFPPVASA
jgi:hypothetical protein